MVSELLWILIAVQMAMGLFDTVYHHELTERLAWRTSQQHELWLHSIRNLLYACLFLVIGWSEPSGLWATAVLALLAIELLITLMDFVEEDMSRKLPPSERINHTLLTLNYGAILVLLIPPLLDRAQNATGWTTAYYGFWSYLTAIAAVGVIVSGVRDFFAARRARWLASGRAKALVDALPQETHVLVTGATGFIGRRLVQALAEAGHHVIVLTRDVQKSAALCPPFTVVTDLDQLRDNVRVDAIVNLAGEPISDGLWTRAKRDRILNSRLSVTREVVRFIARLERSPAVLINGSAIGWYGLRGDEKLSEDDASRSCFSHDLCKSWEHEANKARIHGVRVVCLRIGLVLGIEGGMLSRLLTPFEFGLGGRIGSGQQWMSWIERDDLVRLIAHAISHPELSGAMNATAPHPVRNSEFTHALGQALRRPTILPAPAWLLQLVAGDFARELLLGGQRVMPNKAQASGFVFRHERIETALIMLRPSSADRESGEARRETMVAANRIHPARN